MSDLTFTVFAPTSLRGKPIRCDMGSVTVRNVPAGQIERARDFAARLFARRHRMSVASLELEAA